MLKLRHVSKSYDGRQVLAPVDLEIARGRTTVLIGPSGCGKSTLLRIMIGLIQPDSGTVEIDGTPLAPHNVLTLRHRMGYVLQDGGLFPHLTARQNISLMARHLRWGSLAEVEDRVLKLADLTQLPVDALDRFPAQLSGGQRQRVALMRALMLEPELLLMDEPLGALDPLIRFDLQTDLQRIFRQLQKTVVLVTHDMGEAGFFGDDVLLMGEGRIVQRGSLESMIDSPADEFVQKFITAQRMV